MAFSAAPMAPATARFMSSCSRAWSRSCCCRAPRSASRLLMRCSNLLASTGGGASVLRSEASQTSRVSRRCCSRASRSRASSASRAARSSSSFSLHRSSSSARLRWASSAACARCTSSCNARCRTSASRTSSSSTETRWRCSRTCACRPEISDCNRAFSSSTTSYFLLRCFRLAGVRPQGSSDVTCATGESCGSAAAADSRSPWPVGGFCSSGAESCSEAVEKPPLEPSKSAETLVPARRSVEERARDTGAREPEAPEKELRDIIPSGAEGPAACRCYGHGAGSVRA
mmetsp:Transcript_101672/g.323013  ORF Transcript_101672/g.323013 Transcript_101672/m.323013 type:complete len:287 (+) Transcript_101672:658-1518(+)